MPGRNAVVVGRDETAKRGSIRLLGNWELFGEEPELQVVLKELYFILFAFAFFPLLFRSGAQGGWDSVNLFTRR